MDTSDLVAPPGRFEHPAVDLEGLTTELKNHSTPGTCWSRPKHCDRCRDNTARAYRDSLSRSLRLNSHSANGAAYQAMATRPSITIRTYWLPPCLRPGHRNNVVLAILALSLALLAACGAEDRPLIGYVAPGLSGGCVASIHEANEWYAEKLGFAPLKLRAVDVEPKAPEYREVLFRHREMEKFAGHASWEHDRAGRVHHGTIDLEDGCELRTVVHEMGHVFGLAHEDGSGNVMADRRDAGMALTDEQWERVRVALADL